MVIPSSEIWSISLICDRKTTPVHSRVKLNKIAEYRSRHFGPKIMLMTIVLDQHCIDAKLPLEIGCLICAWMFTWTETHFAPWLTSLKAEANTSNSFALKTKCLEHITGMDPSVQTHTAAGAIQVTPSIYPLMDYRRLCSCSFLPQVSM